jgi:hypothetical protein
VRRRGPGAELAEGRAAGLGERAAVRARLAPRGAQAVRRDHLGGPVAGATGVWANTLQRAPAEIVQPGVCGKGLDKKRWGIFIRLAAAFPDDGEADEG